MNYSIRRPLTVPERNNLPGHSDILSHLLFHRNILDSKSAETFISPDYDTGTHDPFLLKDAERSADRIISAISNNEKIAIYSDYDADGIPGAVMFHDFFKRIGYKKFIIYIPHRHDEGFGVNTEAVEELSKQGVKLMITLDCGITDVEPIRRAAERGIDVIITDHHEPPPELPPAFAILDHKQIDCPYPDKNLCGTGVGFKLIQAILKKNRYGLKKGVEKWFLDLVGIATMSDMVPLVGENRVLARYGLAVLRLSPRKGLIQLFSKLKISQKHLSEDDITFMITPRINAASRMGAPRDAFDWLTADNDEDASEAADHLESVNTERKGLVALLVKEVKKTVRARHGSAIPSVIVLGNPSWRPSLLGLAANSCAEEFDRPVFLWGRDGENLIKGSCRSEGTTHVLELMRAVPTGMFVQYGGHKHSGGFAVSNEQIHYLEQRLNDASKQILLSPRGRGAALIDAELTIDALNQELFDDIHKLAPFGVGNPKPLFLFKNVSPTAIRRFGKTQDHVELVFKNAAGKNTSAISFFGATNDWAKTMEANMPIDLIASLEKSMYRGRAELRLRVVDVFTS